MNKNQLMKFGVWFVIAAQGVFFLFVGMDLDFGSATLPVGLVSCVLFVLVMALLEPRFQHTVRVDRDNKGRLYVNGVPYYWHLLAGIAILILVAILMWVLGFIRLFWRNLLT